MAWAPLLLFAVFSSLCTWSVAQYMVTQAPSRSVSAGESVTLTCTKSGGANSFHWHQQKPGIAPRFVWYGSSTRGPGTPDRFSGSTSGTTGQLTINNVQGGDDGAYYYCVWDPCGSQ